MAFQKSYNASNSNLTAGFEILETNRAIKSLLMDSFNVSNIKSAEAIIDNLDGFLHRYRSHMSLKFFNPFSKEIESYTDYWLAIKKIKTKIFESETLLEEDRMNRFNYIFWLNRWYELLSSCFHKLNLVPSDKMDHENREMLDEEPEIFLGDETDSGSDGDDEEEILFPVQN